MRDSYRLGVLHRRAQFAAGNLLVAIEADFADFDLGSFLDDEVDADRGRWNPAYFSADGCELAPMLRQKILQHHLSFLQVGWIVLALLRKLDFFLLEALEYIALRN